MSICNSLARNQSKCLFLNDEPYMVRSTLIDLSPVELKYSLFIISSDRCTGSCNVFSPKTCFQKKQKAEMLKHFKC